MADCKKSAKLSNLCFLWSLELATVLLEKMYGTDNGSGNKNTRLPLNPYMNLVLYDILYNGSNKHNATSSLVGAPHGKNLTALFSRNDHNFKDMVVFNNPLTLNNNLHSPPVGKSQGFYVYDMKNTYSAWFAFTIVLNSTDYKGTITLAGADPITFKYRDISVVGGTDDFFMARGITTLSTDTLEGQAYFCLRLNITLYECY